MYLFPEFSQFSAVGLCYSQSLSGGDGKVFPVSKTDFPSAGGAGGTFCTSRGRGRRALRGRPPPGRRPVILVSPRLRSWRALHKQHETRRSPTPASWGQFGESGFPCGAGGAGAGPGMRARCLLPPRAILTPSPQYWGGVAMEHVSPPESHSESCFPGMEGGPLRPCL